MPVQLPASQEDSQLSRLRRELGRLDTVLFLISAMVVIDTKTIINYPVGSIADYIGMMVLAQTQIAEDCGGLPSILELMTPKCRGTAPDSITAGDIAYLKALYSIDLGHDVALQRSSIEDLMMRSFTGHE